MSPSMATTPRGAGISDHLPDLTERTVRRPGQPRQKACRSAEPPIPHRKPRASVRHSGQCRCAAGAGTSSNGYPHTTGRRPPRSRRRQTSVLDVIRHIVIAKEGRQRPDGSNVILDHLRALAGCLDGQLPRPEEAATLIVHRQAATVGALRRAAAPATTARKAQVKRLVSAGR
jgi:hypothetical protein